TQRGRNGHWRHLERMFLARERHYRTPVLTVKGKFALASEKSPEARSYTSSRRSVKNVEVSNLAPQRPRFLREFAESPDYILEPAWRGTRALVEVGPRPTAVGYDRKPVAVPRELLDAIVAVIAAAEAV